MVAVFRGQLCKQIRISTGVPVTPQLLQSEKLNRLIEFSRGLRLLDPIAVFFFRQTDKVGSDLLRDSAISAAPLLDIEVARRPLRSVRASFRHGVSENEF